jgi:D-lactate dehydrogenase (cytochrome)
MAVQHKVDLQTLARQLAANQVVTNPIDLLTYDGDAGLDRGQPDGLVFPRTTDDLIQIVRWAREQGVPLVARGAGTGLSGGAVAEHGGLIVAFSRMDRLIEFNEIGRSVIAQPGMITLLLDTTVQAQGLYYPPDPSSGRASTLGGNLAENSGGPHCFKYGVTTNYVTGLRVVPADGRALQLGGGALDYPEYDFVGLMVGSEGTLGLVAEAQLRLMRNPPAVKTLMAAFDSVEQAGAAVSAIIARGLVPATLEMMDQKMMVILEEFTHAGLPIQAGAALIIEADGYPESVTPQIEEIMAILRDMDVRELRVAQTAEERANIWYARKSAAGAMARLAPAYYLVDGTVPRSKLAATLAGVNRVCEAYDLRVGYVFHAGDGNLHPLILIEDPKDDALIHRVIEAGREIMQLCIAQDGSITGEHGVGIEKRAFMPLMYSAEELDAMKTIKTVFDPDNLLNPAKIFPPDAPTAKPLPAPGPSPASPFAPTSAEEAAAAIRAWATAGQRIRIRGGGTKSGRLPPADVLLSTAKLRGIQTCALEDLYVTVGAGTPLAELQAELARQRMWVPLIAPWPEATVGGLVASNLNAPLRIRYGGIRDNLLATRVALPNGRVIRAGRPVVKNVAGYDLPKLLVGAHGTLGLMTEITLKLVPWPRMRSTLVIPLQDLAHGLELSARLVQGCLVASAIVLCRGCDLPGVDTPYALVYTAEGPEQDVQAELAQVRGVLPAGSRDLAEVDMPTGSDVWATFLRESSSEDVTLRVGVPPKEQARVLRELVPMLNDAPLVADMVSGLIYTRNVPDLPALRQVARTAGGYAVVLTAPAGTPLDIWGSPPESLDLMRRLKQEWDAAGMLNPDVFLV